MHYLRSVCLLSLACATLASGETTEPLATKNPPSANQPSTGRWKISGGEALDTQTGLTWMRCSVGMKWDGHGSCSGEKQLLNFNGAGNSSDGHWRAPTASELSTLIDEGKKASETSPVIDTTIFPDMNDGQFWYWTATVSSHNNRLGNVVVFTNGFINQNVYLSNTFPVRLVRGPE